MYIILILNQTDMKQRSYKIRSYLFFAIALNAFLYGSLTEPDY